MANKPSIPARYIFTALVSIGQAILHGLRVNLSMAIVYMINSTEIASMAPSEFHGAHHGNTNDTRIAPLEFACADPESPNVTAAIQEGPFEWPELLQELVLFAYFGGFSLIQIQKKRIAEKFPAKWIIFASVLVNNVFTLLTPLAANTSYIAVIVVRFIEGLGAGVFSTATRVMSAKWVLPQERILMSSLADAGMMLGPCISLPLTAFLADALGWESVFYVQGSLAMIWCVLWPTFVFDSPEDHPSISLVELELFQKSLHQDNHQSKIGHCSNGEGSAIVMIPFVPNEQHTSKRRYSPQKYLPSRSFTVSVKRLKEYMKKQGHHGGSGRSNMPIPWKAVFTSAPFWAILIAHTCNQFGWLLLVEIPTYMTAILRLNTVHVAVLSAIPYVCRLLFSIISMNCLNWFQNKGWITTTTIRKLSTAVGSLFPAACFVGVILVECHHPAAVALITVAAIFIAGINCHVLTNIDDIAPNYASNLRVLTNIVAAIPSFIVPLFVGLLTEGNQTHYQWRIIFFSTSAVFILEFVAYTAFASGEEQPWNQVASGENALEKHTANEVQQESEIERLKQQS